MNIKSFLEDLKEVINYSEDLTAEAIFVAGISLARSKSNLTEILETLKQAQAAFDNDTLSKTNKAIIEFHLYQGQVEEGKKLLQSHLSKPQGPKPELNGNSESSSKPSLKVPIHIKSPKIPEINIKPINSSTSEQLKNFPTAKKKISPEDLQKIEQQAFEVLGILKRIDEKEALLQRKLEEQKRLDSEKEAKELKDRLEREYQEKLLKQLEDEKRREQQAIRCTDCKEKVQDKDLCMLEKCSHFFHKKCLKDQIIKDLDNKVIPIKCKSCKTELTIVEINSNLSKRQSQLYSDLTFKAFMHSEDSVFSSCPTAGCRNMFEYEEGQDDYHCKLCNRGYCLNCRRVAHPGYTCEDLPWPGRVNRVVGMAMGQKFKSCMMCGFWVEKTDSIRLRCTCGTIFCYTCGSYQGCKCE